MMISYETAFSWLNKFQDQESYISNFARRLVTQLEDAFKEGEYENVSLYIDLLKQAADIVEPGSPERAEILVLLSKYELTLDHYEAAATLLREAVRHYYPSYRHNIGVTQWLLGCVLWKIPEERKPAISVWQKTIEIFRSLSNTYDSAEADWYLNRTQEMEDALIESSERIEKPKKPKTTGTPSESDELAANLGVLRIGLTDVIPAGALAEILSLLDDVYVAHAWQSLADTATPENPIPDSYQPVENETMHISHLEIGTPNFIEFFGQAENLLAVLGVVGSAIGLATATVNMIKVGFEIKNLSLDLQLKRLSIIGKELDLKRKLAENRPKVETNTTPTNLRTDEIHIQDIIPGFEDDAIDYAARGLMSRTARNHLINFQEALDERKKILIIYIIGEPTLTILSETVQDSTEPPVNDERL